MKPICVPCQRFYRPKKNGFYFIEGQPRTNTTPPGTTAPDDWTPYKLWVGDLWECQGCHAQIVSGVSQEPLGEHYQPDFAAKVARTHADQLQVNDC
jgi:hypothetical protein